VVLVAIAASCSMAAPAEPIPSLALTDDPTTTELVNLATGAATTLGDQATGDRAVLVWYWAPD